MTCDCIKIVNVKLAERNTGLNIPLVLGAQPGEPVRLLVETYQLEKGHGKPKAVSMFASCCPFCGVRYEPEPAVPAETGR